LQFMASPRCVVALLLALSAPVDGFAVAMRPALRVAPPAQRTSIAAPANMMLPARTVTALGLNSALAAIGTAKGQKVLTPMGLAHSWALGVMLWASLGWRGWTTCVVYLIGGSAVTKVRKKKKEALGIAESQSRGGARGPENVWGAAATAAVCALSTLRWPASSVLLRVGFVASLATKLSDTFASEIGKAYGTKTYKITTLRECKPGEEGGVSLEGTVAGVGGSILLTAYAYAVSVVGSRAVVPCLLAAFIATNIESVIGAVAQGGWLTNEVVNFIMTVIGACVGVALAVTLGV